MNDLIKAVGLRFIRGAVTSGVAAMVVITPIGIQNFDELEAWLWSLALAAIVGGISGGLLAVDKLLRFKE